MRYFTTLLAFSLLFVPASAQEKKDAHAAIRSLLDADTAFVVWIDLKQIDLDAMPKFIGQLGSNVADENIDEVKSIRDALVELGVERAYMLLAIEDLQSGPQAILLPVAKTPPVALIVKSLMGGDESQGKVVEKDGFVVAGTTEKVDQLLKISGKPRPELEAAITSITGPHGIAFSVSSEQMGTFLSWLPPFIGDDISELAKVAELIESVSWVSASGEFPPQAGVVRLETNSPESAAKIRDWFTAFTAKRLKENKDAIPLVVEGNAVIFRSDSLEKSVGAMLAFRDLTAYRGPLNAMNAMRQIALAIHNFHDTYRHLPPQSLVSADGKRLLSWRVLVLPYLGQQALYDQFHLDEPWDSPHNKTLLAEMPDVYKSTKQGVPAGHTTYLATLTANSPFGHKGAPLQFADINDGTSNTIWLVDAPIEKAVEWTKPADLIVDTDNPVSSLTSADQKVITVSILDGSVRSLDAKISKETLNALLTHAGGEVIPDDAR